MSDGIYLSQSMEGEVAKELPLTGAELELGFFPMVFASRMLRLVIACTVLRISNVFDD
jgi:hypothetical protein